MTFGFLRDQLSVLERPVQLGELLLRFRDAGILGVFRKLQLQEGRVLRVQQGIVSGEERNRGVFRELQFVAGEPCSSRSAGNRVWGREKSFRIVDHGFGSGEGGRGAGREWRGGGVPREGAGRSCTQRGTEEKNNSNKPGAIVHSLG